MIANTVNWIIHWLGQGLKLGLFSTVATMTWFPIYLPLGWLDDWASPFAGLSLPGKLAAVAGYVTCYATGIAVFTAVLASQLKDQPLRPYTPRPGNNRRREGARR
jgi:hypothetical protein